VTTPEIELRHVWRRVAGAHHDQIIDGLLARHREPHRRYHTATHVMWVCRHVSELVNDHPVDDLEAVLAAALFHDAVYDPRSSRNEADSAELAVARLGEAGWSTERCASVASLIVATAHRALDHQSSGIAEDVLLDADLAILGASAQQYLAYAVAVRAEYAQVDDHAWRSGRAGVLQQFLDRSAIYRTRAMSQAREVRARANIAAELASLDTHG
jgi:predicted metal-dependent HD superfamily phosphohydrolase